MVLPRRRRTIAVYRVVPFACFRALIVAIPHLEETRYSCLLYVSSATDKLPGIRRNPAETPSMENTGKIGISSEKHRVLIDRRLSVAPMMDWTDRHCRYFHRLFSPHALLYTEMGVSAGIVPG